MKPLFPHLTLFSALCLLSPLTLAAAPMVKLTPQQAQQQQQSRQQQQLQRWIFEAARLDLNQISQQDSGWFIADFQPTFPGHPIINQRATVKDGVATIVAGSDSKPLSEGKYRIVAGLETLTPTLGDYSVEFKWRLFRSGRPRTFDPTRPDPLLSGGVALAQLDSNHQPISPVIPIPKEWASDIKTAVEKRRQDPAQGQLQRRTLEQLLEMLPAASPVESFPIWQ